ncbi:MAG TPA: T9SS type A sorting domain-containing protein, partial [Chitinispirillaceae bacterium]|nr:T9SS type A sorting domain-containing protein [Chitinispirillaceae bacterium]
MRKKYLMLMLVLSGFPLASIWAQDTVRVNFTGVDTALKGQNLTMYLRNPVTGQFVDSLKVTPIDSTNFTLSFNSVAAGNYYLDFFSDVNSNGSYDSPPDNSWRIMLDSLKGDTTIVWMYDTNYTDIKWQTGGDTSLVDVGINFHSFSPHVGQNLYVYLRDHSNGDRMDSLFVTPVDTAEFAIVFDSVKTGSYNVDFWADKDNNGSYDKPPQDHAWRIELMNLEKDTIVDFTHNTDFVDIFPVEDTTGGNDSTIKVSIDFAGFDSAVDKNLIVYLRDPQTNEFVDSVKVTPIDSNAFTVVFNTVNVNNNYNIDFYTDVNGNGKYDAPPLDNAWRLQVINVVSDTVIMFMYDTVYTDIGLGQATPVKQVDGDAEFYAFPNPVQDELNVSLSTGGTGLSVYNVTGALVLHKSLTASDRLVRLNVSALKPGMYILRLNTLSGMSQKKFLKE